MPCGCEAVCRINSSQACARKHSEDKRIDSHSQIHICVITCVHIYTGAGRRFIERGFERCVQSRGNKRLTKHNRPPNPNHSNPSP